MRTKEKNQNQKEKNFFLKKKDKKEGSLEEN